MRNQQRLMDVQQRNQMDLNRQGKALQMEMWNETNYGAQMKHMKEAGLNPALMYGMKGGGGATTGSQGGGSASGGNAQMSKVMALEGMQMQSQIDLTKAQTNKVKAEEDSIRGVEGTTGNAQIKKLLAEVTTEGQKAGLTLQQAIKTAEEIGALSRDNSIKDADLEMVRREWVASVLGKEVGNKLTEETTKLSQEQQRKIYHDIIQGYVNNGIKGAEAIINGVIKGKTLKQLMQGNERKREIFEHNKGY